MAIPTETVYGLAANGLDTHAVARIFEAKNRPTFDPLILHAPTVTAVQQLTTQWPTEAALLAEACWPGPLTLVLPRAAHVPDLVTAGLDTVGLRIPQHPLTLALLALLDFPLAAPSANPFGYVSPTTAQHVADQLPDCVEYILDGGPCTIGVESTIVGFPNGEATVLRLGGTPLEKLERLLGHPLRVHTHSTSRPNAPGMLSSHYAPRKRVLAGTREELLNFLQAQAAIGAHSAEIAALVFSSELPMPVATQWVLSADGSVNEAAYHLFGALRTLDSDPRIQLILAEWAPEHGLGRAINDRLRRASA